MAVSISYLYGRLMNITIARNVLDARLFNRDNGHGAAEEVIARLRAQQKTAN